MSNKHASPNFRRGAGDRPMTASDPVSTTLSKMRNRSEYLRFKHEGEATRVVLGNENHSKMRSTMGGTPAAKTDYRSNF